MNAPPPEGGGDGLGVLEGEGAVAGGDPGGGRVLGVVEGAGAGALEGFVGGGGDTLPPGDGAGADPGPSERTVERRQLITIEATSFALIFPIPSMKSQRSQ